MRKKYSKIFKKDIYTGNIKYEYKWYIIIYKLEQKYYT